MPFGQDPYETMSSDVLRQVIEQQFAANQARGQQQLSGALSIPSAAPAVTRGSTADLESQTGPTDFSPYTQPQPAPQQSAPEPAQHGNIFKQVLANGMMLFSDMLRKQNNLPTSDELQALHFNQGVQLGQLAVERQNAQSLGEYRHSAAQENDIENEIVHPPGAPPQGIRRRDWASWETSQARQLNAQTRASLAPSQIALNEARKRAADAGIDYNKARLQLFDDKNQFGKIVARAKLAQGERRIQLMQQAIGIRDRAVSSLDQYRDKELNLRGQIASEIQSSRALGDEVKATKLEAQLNALDDEQNSGFAQFSRFVQGFFGGDDVARVEAEIGQRQQTRQFVGEVRQRNQQRFKELTPGSQSPFGNKGATAAGSGKPSGRPKTVIHPDGTITIE